MLETIPLARAELTIGESLMVGQIARGTRLVAEITGAQITGDRLSASMIGKAAADWAIVRSDGVVEADVRMTLKTDDGAIVHLSYQGTVDMDRGEQPILSIMRFEVGDERYSWLNRVCAVGKGSFEDDVVAYDIYELR